MAELGPTLFLVFIIFSFPLLAFATVGMRYIFLLNAAKDAAIAGSMCQNWTTVQSTVQTVATNAAKAFNGVTLSGTPTCQIMVTTVTNGISTVTGPFSGPYTTSTSSNGKGINTTIFSLRVTLNGSITPVVPNANLRKWFGAGVPGLTDPITTYARSDVVFENAAGATHP